jgi:hypothetical protein
MSFRDSRAEAFEYTALPVRGEGGRRAGQLFAAILGLAFGWELC